MIQWPWTSIASPGEAPLAVGADAFATTGVGCCAARIAVAPRAASIAKPKLRRSPPFVVISILHLPLSNAWRLCLSGYKRANARGFLLSLKGEFPLELIAPNRDGSAQLGAR